MARAPRRSTGDKSGLCIWILCLFVCLFSANFLIFFCSIRPLHFKKTFREWIPMYWHRTHKTSLRVKKTIRELMPCTVGAWWCVWGDHVWGWGWLNVAIFRDHYWPAQSVTRLYWQQEGPMFSYSLYVVCCLYVTFLLPPERATKAGPCHFLTKVYIQK